MIKAEKKTHFIHVVVILRNDRCLFSYTTIRGEIVKIITITETRLEKTSVYNGTVSIILDDKVMPTREVVSRFVPASTGQSLWKRLQT